MKKAFRISYNRWYDDEIFAEHLAFIKKNIEIIDEVALLREYSHVGYWPLETEKTVTKLIQKRIKQYKEAGVKSVGINMMCTIGHTDESWDVMPKLGMPHYTGNDGTESKNCMCYTSDEFIKYITERYTLYAQTEPDFIWLDDDIRPLRHGIMDGCYCDGCIEKFNIENNTNFNRASLVSAIKEDNIIEEKWNNFRYEKLKNLAVLLKDTIKSINPSIKIGYMSTTDNAYPNLISCLESEKLRPGGGYYNDSFPNGLPNLIFDKVFCTGMQIKECGNGISDIQYEYETFPYLSMNKSNTITQLETAAGLMYGNNGVAYNIFHRDDNQRLMDGIAEHSRLWDEMNCFEYKNSGVYCYGAINARWLNELSIPTTPDLSHSQAAFILADEWNNLSDDEINAILAKSVLTDGKGLKVLIQRGFGKYCGGTIKNEYTNGMAERFTEHSLNGKYKGVYRDVFMTFYHRNSAVCHEFDIAPDAEVLTNLETVSHNLLGCGMYLYKNELGGTIVVNGYLQEEFLRSEAKRLQLINVFDYLSNGKMPVRTDNGLKVVPIVRENDGGDMMIMLVNSWFDKTGEFECRVNTSKPLCVINCDGSKSPIKQQIIDKHSIITVSNIQPWSYIVLSTN